MAEYCLDCLNKINGTNHSSKKFIISDELDLCEGCSQWKNVVVARRRNIFIKKIRRIIFSRYYSK